jgi:hypothetical protein
MLSEEEILVAARAIRPILPGLLGTKAEAVDYSLAELIQRGEAGEPVGKDILALLTQEEPTCNWLQEYFSDTAEDLYNFGLKPLPGRPHPIKAARYACPVKGCPTVWHQQRAGQPIPACPTHHVTLALSP